MRPSSPRRIELGAESYDEQHRKSFNLVHRPTENFQARGVDPMRIFERSSAPDVGLPIPQVVSVKASSVLCLRCSGVNSSAG